jgi:predicted permease
VAQIALSVLLFAGAGLFVRTLHNLKTLDLGFRREKLLSFSIDFGRAARDRRNRLDVHRRVLAALEPLPGLKGVTLSGAGLLSSAGYATGLSIEGYTPAPDEAMRASGIIVGPKFFPTMGVPLLRGREFDDREQVVPADPMAPDRPVAIILGEAMARKYFGDTDPVGRHVTLGLRDGVTVEIVGVARDTTYRTLREKTPLQFYVPYFGGLTMMPMVFRLRTAGEPLALAADIRRIVQQIDPTLGVKELRTMEDVVASQLVQERMIAQLAGFFSVFALTLSSLGLYGTLSYAVARRTREIGVRMALGASVRSVLALVVRQGVALALLGCGVGLAGAFALTRLVASLLYGVEANDPITFAATALILLAVALLASWIPAQRAAKVDPMVALRYE